MPFRRSYRRKNGATTDQSLKETVVPARIMKLWQGGKHEKELGSGSAITGKVRPRRKETTVMGCLTLLALASLVGFRTGTRF